MDLLRRRLAPITAEVWNEIDDEARRALELNLGGRKLVGFEGPLGRELAAVNLGWLKILGSTRDGVQRAVRRVQPLAEVRVPVDLKIVDLDAAARGARDVDWSALVDAAKAIARVEDGAIFEGDDELGIEGIVQASPHERRSLPDDPQRYAHVIAETLSVLHESGVGGPYGLALGDRAYRTLNGAADDGYPLRKRVEALLEGPIVHAPALEGAVCMSVRGGDFVLTVGQDMSVGYADSDRDRVELYLTESFSFRILEPAAAVVLA